MSKEYFELRQKFPDRIPVLLHSLSKRTIVLKDHKFLVPKSLKIGEFMFIIRSRLHITAETAIFIFVKKQTESTYVIPLASASVETIAENFAYIEGHLPIFVATENTFG
jgi:GABA(A) receptor-associated protein